MRFVDFLLLIPICYATSDDLLQKGGHKTCIVYSPGASFRDGCNWCSCYNNHGLCTKIYCSPPALLPLIGTPNCRGQISWVDQCNVCVCDPETGYGNCSKKNCSDVPHRLRRSLELSSFSDSFRCREHSKGSWWTQGCNYCHCVHGRSLCSQRLCEIGMPVIDTLECEGDVQWAKDKCNTCRCHEGSIVCTEDPCGNDLKSSPGKA